MIEDYLKKLLGSNSFKTVVSVGCGDAAKEKRLMKVFPDIDFVLLDIKHNNGVKYFDMDKEFYKKDNDLMLFINSSAFISTERYREFLVNSNIKEFVDMRSYTYKFEFQRFKNGNLNFVSNVFNMRRLYKSLGFHRVNEFCIGKNRVYHYKEKVMV